MYVHVYYCEYDYAVDSGQYIPKIRKYIVFGFVCL